MLVTCRICYQINNVSFSSTVVTFMTETDSWELMQKIPYRYRFCPEFGSNVQSRFRLELRNEVIQQLVTLHWQWYHPRENHV